MLPSSQEFKLADLRGRLSEVNFKLFLTLDERKILCQQIQDLKPKTGPFSHYDPQREGQIFQEQQDQLKKLSLRELLAFSLMMEEHAQGQQPNSYPAWSTGNHLKVQSGQLLTMINPLLLKFARPDDFIKLQLNSHFIFLREF